MTFESRLYTKGKVNFPLIRKLTILSIVIYSILVFLSYKNHGLDLFMVSKHIITYSLCLILLLITKPKNDYQKAIALVDLDDVKFSISYGNPEDEAAYVPSTANVSIFYKNIDAMKYDKFSQELFIREVSAETKEEAFTIIYIPEQENSILTPCIMSHVNAIKELSQKSN